MDIFRAEIDDKILFVGEGNFSFCVDFVKIHSNSDTQLRDFEVIATCLESDNNLSPVKKSNIEFLANKGVTILYNVDAKHLKDHATIGNKVFTKIIFNFPHVGGKMKIQLNRQLLSEFFLSSKCVLNESGVILLTLCDGQGGTNADSNKRRWDDSWKVVELAAEADLALINVHHFDRANFPGYVNVGYRSLEKGFNTENALIHEFKICQSHLITQFSEHEIQSLFNNEKPLLCDNKLSKVYAQKISQDPLSNTCSPHSFLYQHVKTVTFEKEIHFLDNVTLVYGYSCSDTTSSAAVKRHLDIKACYENSIKVYKGMHLHQLTSDFSQQPVSCEVVCVGSDCCKFVIKVLTQVFALFSSFNHNIIQCNRKGEEIMCIESLNSLIVAKIELVILNDCKVEICTIFLDNLAVGILSLSGWHELWAKNNRVVQDKGKFKLLTPCIFPCTYTFDLSFSILKGCFKEGELINILWHTAGNIIVDVSLVSSYEPPNKSGCINYCYRIKYRSYEVPLFKKRTVEIQCVLGKILQDMLNLTVL